MGYNGEQNQTQKNLHGTYKWAKQTNNTQTETLLSKGQRKAALRADRQVGVTKVEGEGEGNSIQESLAAEKNIPSKDLQSQSV